MTLIFGIRSGGRIYDASNQLISTTFIHVFFIPVIPLSCVVVDKKGLFHDEGEPAEWNWTSIFAGYARVLPVFLFCNAGAAFINSLFLERYRNQAIVVACAAAALIAFRSSRTLSISISTVR